MRILSLALALCVFTAVRADETGDRERRARAALALASVKTVPTAPAPRAVEPRTYADGYKVAADTRRPLVVFVGCDREHNTPGCVTARVSAMGDVKSPGVVVGYPVGDRLYVHKVLKCPVTDEELSVAVRAAIGKISHATKDADAAAPRPVDWNF